MPDLNPEPPELSEDTPTHVLDWFWELSKTRVFNDGYPRHILPTEVEAWSRLTGSCVTVPEYRLIDQMDSVYCKEYSELISNARAQYNNKGRGNS